MNEVATIIVLAIMMLAIDFPWLTLQGPWVQQFVQEIQGDRPMQVRMWAGIPV